MKTVQKNLNSTNFVMNNFALNFFVFYKIEKTKTRLFRCLLGTIWEVNKMPSDALETASNALIFNIGYRYHYLHLNVVHIEITRENFEKEFLCKILHTD